MEQFLAEAIDYARQGELLANNLSRLQQARRE